MQKWRLDRRFTLRFLTRGNLAIRLKDMVKAGLVLDIVGWFLTVFIILVVARWIFGVL